MRIDVLTLFPRMFDNFLEETIVGRAVREKIVDINVIDFREFSDNKHMKVDDTPFGGGAGMVLRVQPVYDALKSIEGNESALKIMMTPQGSVLKQDMLAEYKERDHVIILCGHYEGFDERIRRYFDLEISIGDFVLTGGEIASMVLIDGLVRLLPDALNKEESHLNDSFQDGLLEHPHYTRPRAFDGMDVPEVLFSGHHQRIETWRFEESLKRTKERRKDLYKAYMKKHKAKK
ncbi:MAG: tRNA (guanosine(37)-N1)-methyltransferase TrmD [Candidatus Izemoplasmataceae bacterium]